MTDRPPSAGPPGGERSPLLVRLLVDLLNFERRRHEDDVALVTRWLVECELGAGLADHLSAEAELLEMAANRLNICGDEELREIGREVGATSERLRRLVGPRHDCVD
jgi:hypothetical protein